MNTTTKASLGFTVILLVVALIFAVQNMTELKSVRKAVEDRDARIALLDQQLAHERDVYKTLVERTQKPQAPAAAGRARRRQLRSGRKREAKAP